MGTFVSSTAILVGADSVFRTGCARTLRHAGLHVAEAADAAEMRRLMTIHSPDVVLIDPKISRTTSRELWHTLEDPAEDVPVIVLGSIPDVRVRADAECHGAVCVSPESEIDLIAEVKSLMARWETASQEIRRIHSELRNNLAEFQACLATAGRH